MINLFISLLRNCKSPGVQSDLALMDIGARYFTRLQRSTQGDISVAFAGELAALAHNAVHKPRLSKAVSPTADLRQGQSQHRHSTAFGPELPPIVDVVGEQFFLRVNDPYS